MRNRDDFYTAAAHELNTPLTVLGLQAYYLENALQRGELGKLSPERDREMLRANAREIKRMADLVNDLLEGAMVAAGHLKLRAEEMSLPDVVEQVLRDSEEAVRKSGSAVEIESVPVRGNWDKRKLTFLVKTLVQNALKYGEGQPVQISTSVKEGRARLVVEDRGVGLPEKDQPRAFERFGRMVRLKSFGGMGQSLYISKAIAEAHGGSIQVKSGPGRGTRFVVELPL